MTPQQRQIIKFFSNYSVIRRRLTPELTGCADTANRFKLSIKAMLFALRLNELLDDAVTE